MQLTNKSYSSRGSYCSNFCNERNGIFVLGVGFFFFRQISTFELAIFDVIIYITQKVLLS